MVEQDPINGNGVDRSKDNVVRLPTLAERQAMQRAQMEAAKSSAPPLINLPPVTQALLLIMIGIHAALVFIAGDAARYDVYQHFGFISGYYTGAVPFSWTAIASPITYMALHGSWMHVAVNGLMLAAFGAGVERWLGPWRMLVFFTLCGVIAALLHLAVNPFSTDPVIGASGGLSGLFAAVLVMMNRQSERLGYGQQKMLPFIVVWLVVTVGTGILGIPGGNNIAWDMHVGGFLSGFALLRLMKKA